MLSYGKKKIKLFMDIKVSYIGKHKFKVHKLNIKKPPLILGFFFFNFLLLFK